MAGAASSACIGGFDAARITPGGLLNHLQALSQQRSIAVVQVDVISGGAAVHQANCLPTTKATASASVSKKGLSASLRSLELSHIIVRHDLSTKVLHVEYDFAESMREPVCALLDCLAEWDKYTKQRGLTSPGRDGSYSE